MSKHPSGPIITTAAQLPRRCPAQWDSVPTRTSERGGVTRLTCAACGWSEAYLVVARVPDAPIAVKGGQNLMFKKRHRVGPHRGNA